jgi:hypothetical protein
MTGICIYEGNRGLGACEGPVSKVKVTSKRTPAWKGLNALTERLKDTGEEPGVCKAHEKRAGENGYVLALDEAPRKTKATRKPAAEKSSTAASAPRVPNRKIGAALRRTE